MPDFPTSLDSFTELDCNTPTAPYVVINEIQDVIEAIEAKVGANSSAVNTSHDYKLSEVTDKAVGKTAIQTLTGKSMDGDDNTFTDLSLNSLKVDLANANKFIQRNSSGTVVSGKSVPTGDVVGTSDTQTLTGKTINGNDNTITNVTLANTTGTLPINRGGTGQTTANNALNALLPAQASNSGKFLTTNGTNTSWDLMDLSGLTTDDLDEGSTNIYFTDERAQDAVGGIMVDTDTINVTYNDADVSPTIVLDVKKQNSITSDSSGIKLVNDITGPGNNYYYGTNSSGVKGFHLLTSSGGGSSLTVEEQDGTPSVINVTTIKVTNGTLTDEGSGIVSIDTGGGSGGAVETIVEGSGIVVDSTDPANPVVSVTSGLSSISSLSDPNADRILFWDDSANEYAYLTASTGLTITGTNMTVRTASTTQTGIVELATTGEAAASTDTSRAVTAQGVDVRIKSPRALGNPSGGATPAINVGTYDYVYFSGLSTDITSMTTGLTGFPNLGQYLLISFEDNGTARSITWGAKFRGGLLPTTTIVGQVIYVELVYQTSGAVWDCIGVSHEPAVNINWGDIGGTLSDQTDLQDELDDKENAFLKGSLIAGTGVTLTGILTDRLVGDGDVTIEASSGGGITWSEVTGTSQTASVNNGYIANNAGLVTITLPTTAAVGSVVRVAGRGAGGWLIAQNASEIIRFGNTSTTTGTGGSISSTHIYDAVELLCIVADTEWVVISSVGNITIT